LNILGLKASERDIYQTIQAEHSRVSRIMNCTKSDKVTERDKFVKQLAKLVASRMLDHNLVPFGVSLK
jgi:hypothetical protein